MTVIYTTIEINASPAAVRAKFLDLDSLPVYHKHGFFKSITQKNVDEPIAPGVKFINDIELGTFEATLIENSTEAFRWAGGIWGLFYGTHSWEFKQGPNGPNSTTLVHKEEFSGLLSFMIGEPLGSPTDMRTKTTKGFIQFNEDIKRACETGART